MYILWAEGRILENPVVSILLLLLISTVDRVDIEVMHGAKTKTHSQRHDE